MKKRLLSKITLVVFMAMTAISAYAGGGWATSAISLTLDGGSAYNYILNDEGWTDGSWGSNTAFQGYSFGIPASLVLNGASGNGWTDDSPGYDATSFKLYYRAYLTGDTPGTWNSMDLDFLAYNNGNNKIWDKTNANIDVLALVGNQGGNYTLEVVMSKNQFYTGGNWNSMVPGGQGTAYNSATAGFTATFQILTTGLHTTSSGTRVFASNGNLTVNCPTNSSIEVYTLNGLKILKTVASSTFVKTLPKGNYIVKVNGKATKVSVL